MTTRTAAALISGLLLFATAAVAAPAGTAADAGVTPKLSAPVGIRYTLATEPAVGQPLDLRIAITPEVPVESAVLTLGVDDPLALLEPAPETALGAIAAGESVEITVTVLPLTQQTHYLHVAVTVGIDGQGQLKTLTIPIRLPQLELRKAAGDPAGVPADRPDSGVHSLKAVETFR